MVVAAAEEYFDEENRGIVGSERASVVVEDARTYIASARNRFDIIAGDLYRPYGAGEGRLYSLEHFRNVRLALRTGGVYCQWIPAYQLTEEHFRMIAATFLQAFPDAVLLCADAETNHAMLGLLGTKDTAVDWDEVEARGRAYALRDDVKDPLLRDADYVKSLYVANLSEEQFPNARINTLENSILEITAGLHRATHDRNQANKLNENPYLRGEIWKAFLQKMRQPSPQAGK